MSNKILFVEDEEDLTLIVADTLRGEGYEVVTAVDGEDGLEKFKTEAADIVVADVMMSNMDGFTMAKEIRKLLLSGKKRQNHIFSTNIISYTCFTKKGLSFEAM